MIEPLTRSTHLPSSSAHPRGGFAETIFLEPIDDEGVGAFAPTQSVSEEDERCARSPAAGVRHLGGSWATSRWVAKQEALAHEAADKARSVIAAQRQSDAPPPESEATWRSGLAALRAAFERLLPLFIGVAVTMALISAMLPLFDKP